MTDAAALFHFDGRTFIYERDSERLTCQVHRVFSLMKDGKARTLAEIAEATKDPEASVSARLRDIRKPRFQKVFGPCTITREYVSRGLWRYRMEFA